MKNRQFIFLLLFSCLFACTKAKKSLDFISVESGETVLSLVEGKYIIGQTEQKSVTAWDSLLAAGLELIFDENEILKVAILSSEQFQTRKGFGVGDNRSAIRLAYGNPMLENVSLQKGAYSIGQMEMLVYKHAIFLMQSDTCRMIWLMEEHADLPRIYKTLEGKN